MNKKKNTEKSQNNFEIFLPENKSAKELSLINENISAGFPSPAEDYIDQILDLNEYMIKNLSTTFLIRVSGDSMINAGIYNGDILVVDRSLEPANNKIIIGVIDGEFLVKRIIKKSGKLFLQAENDMFKPIEINSDSDFKVWGVVTFAIHKF